MKTEIYKEPKKFIMSKEKVPDGYMVVGYFDDLITTISCTIESSKDAARERAERMGANSILEQRTRSIQSQDVAANGYISNYREHVISGRPALLKKVCYSSDELEILQSNECLEVAKRTIDQANAEYAEASKKVEIIPYFGFSGSDPVAAIFELLWWPAQLIINILRASAQKIKG